MEKAATVLLIPAAFSYLYHAKSKDMVNIPEIQLVRHPKTGEIYPEVWADVLGYEGLYSISNYSRIVSFKKSSDGILLNPGKGSKGYLTVSLSKNGVAKGKRLHKLTFISFNGDTDDPNLVIDHIDNNKYNNMLFNLQRITLRENCAKDVKLSSSGHKGVYQMGKNYWYVATTLNRKTITLGFAKTIEAAVVIYKEGTERLGLK